MSCNGIAVQTAEVAINLYESLQNPETLQEFAEYANLKNVQLTTYGELYSNGDRVLRFNGTRISAYTWDILALQAAEQFAAELLQADVLESFHKLGTTYNIQVDEQGELAFNFEV